MRSRHLLKFLSFSLTLLLTSWSAAAQSLTISGTVADTQSVPVAEATVSLTLSSAAGRRITTTDASGRYRFEGLTGGSYQLVFDHAGYEAQTRSGSLASNLEISATLPVAGTVTSIDVTDVAGKATASRLDIPDRDLPVQVSTIPQQLLQQQGVNDMVTALRNASGVQAQRWYGVYEYYTIRGFNSSDVMLVDGMRLEGNRFNTQTNNIQSIEVLKGPASVLYGGSAVGGVINVVRKKPQGTRAYDVMYRGGRFNTHQVAGGATGPVFNMNRLLYRVDASHDYTDGWRGAGSKRTNVSPSLTYLFNESARVTVHQTFNHDNFRGDGGVAVGMLNVPGFDLSRRFSLPSDFVKINDSQTHVLLNVNLGKLWEFRDGLLVRRTSDEYLVTEGIYYDPATNSVPREALYFHHNRRPTINQADVVGRLNFLKMHHTILLGHEYQDFYTRTGVTPGGGFYDGLTALNLANPVETDPGITDLAIVRNTYQANRINAFFWQDQIEVSSKLKINIGGRLDNFKRGSYRTFTTDPTVRTRDFSLDLNAYTYRAGIVYSPVGSHQIYFNASSSFTPPNSLPPSGAELRPQYGHLFEVGHRWQGWNNRIKTSAAAYDIELDNVTFSSGLTTALQARQVAKGVDIDINADLGHDVHLLANYGFTDSILHDFIDPDAEEDYSGNHPRFTQKHAANAWLTKTWRSGWTASAGARYLGPMFTNNANTIRLGGWTTFSGSVSYRRGIWEYQVNAENLLNRNRYFTGSDYQNQVYPGAPINVFGTIRLRFN
ncbi:MAG: TonB-dependent receptor [Bryobacteraceae bacterium]